MTELKLNSKHWTIIGATLSVIFLHMKGMDSWQEFTSIKSVGEIGLQVAIAVLGLLARSVNKPVEMPLLVDQPKKFIIDEEGETTAVSEATDVVPLSPWKK